MSRRFDRFIAALSCVRLSDRACNQYSRFDGDLRGNAIRRRNLKRYLEGMDAIGPDTLLVGEAPSYRGGRLTGIAFVSERIMLDLLGPRYRKATTGDELSTEASATMVWSVIREMHPRPLLWNAFPFHPFHRGNPRSNRVPDKSEIDIGQHFLRALIRLYGFRNVVAIGNQAAQSLTRMEIPHEKVRHPSQGGKTKFVTGMERVSAPGKALGFRP